MKEIKAIIQPFKLDAVLNALHGLGDLPSVAVSVVEAVDTRQELYDRAHKVRLELMVPSNRVEEVAAAIQAAAHTGKPGDGRIFVIPIDESILIRTGERGHEVR